MSTQRAKNLTPEQAQRMGAEYQQLMDHAAEQLSEHRMWLYAQLADLDTFEVGISPHDKHTLLESVHAITLEMVRLEPAMKADGAQTISVVYSYPDTLHAFLLRTDLGALDTALQGGIALDTPQP